MNVQYLSKITELKEDEIFVFGSNEAGIHGAGAAKYAKEKFGATIGVGRGLTGQCYALPTKDKNIKRLPISSIRNNVEEFIEVVKNTPEKRFLLTSIGCGYAGYAPEEIAPLFLKAKNLPNLYFPKSFYHVLNF